MKSLIITAHPSTLGFTHQIATTYKKAKEKLKNNVEIIDLYSDEYKQDFFRYEDIPKNRILSDIDLKIQQKIQQSDELVFVFPIWWADAPAILKNFIDRTFSAGFAFSYDNGKAEGLLQGKIAHIFTTSDAPGWLYTFLFHIPRIWNMGRLGFCGIKIKSFTILGKKREKSQEELKKFLKKVEKIAQK